jgi:protein gp37
LVDELAAARKLAAGNSTVEILNHLRRRVDALAFARIPRTNGIDWSDRSWNPLFGCKPVSDGCKHCYAAKLFGTRLAGRFPGLVCDRKKGEPYRFNGAVRLDVAALAEPLEVRKPLMYFVNSLSDLFHDAVPDWFVDAVFQTMEQASWHSFQLLTKRPARMADYTAKRYAAKAPPKHIWAGITVENQTEHDARMPHLRRTRAAVRWVSAEPLLGSVKFDLRDVDWVVVGGESGSTRAMKPEWAHDVRKQCAAHSIPFFFKQWGYRLEDGSLASRSESEAYRELGGKLCQEFP